MTLDGRRGVDGMNREEALAAFAACVSDEGDGKAVFLTPELLEQIAIIDLPVGVVVTVGIWIENRWFKRLWDGRLVRDADGSFWSIIRYDLYPGAWMEVVGANFYFDLLHKCILNRTNTMEDLIVDEFDSDELSVCLEYRFRFPVDGVNLKEAFEKARRIQRDLEAPAEQVLDDVWRTLARSANRALRGHYSQVSELIAHVEAAEYPSDKGAALESLMAALFEQVPGFAVWERDVRTETEEIDLILLNDSQDPVYSRDGPLVLVECKNWTTKPGRPDFSVLEGKIRNRHNRCTVAFFVSWSGFTETAWRETIRLSRENYVIVFLTGSDVRRAALAGNFPEFLRQATLHALNR
jgi:hypothetical protein